MKLPLSQQLIYSCVLVVTMSILPLVSGCVTNGEKGIEGADIASVAKMLPDNTEFLIYVDVEEFRNDARMSEIYDGFKCFYNIMLSMVTFGKWSGVPFPETSWGAYAAGLGGDSPGVGSLIIGGRFDRNAIGEEFAANGWEQGEHKGYAVWRYYGSTSVVVTDDFYIAGRGSDCIDVITGDRSSLYDRPEVPEFFSRLSPECFVGMVTDGSSLQSGYEWGQIVEGVSLAKNDDRTMSAHAVFIFQDGDEALDAVEEIKVAVADGWGWPLNTGVIEVNAEDNVVNVWCEIDLEDIENLAHRPELQDQCE